MEIRTGRVTHTVQQSAVAVTDHELVARVRTGDIDAFECIMRRHNQRLFRVARSILREDQEAMDAVQETWIKAWFQVHQFKGPDGFASWLSRIAANEAMMRVRKSTRLSYTLDDPEHEHMDLESPEPPPMDTIANLQLRKFLEDAIDTLPVSQRSVYVMRAIQQLSIQETARCLDISEDVVKTRFVRARHALQKIFTGHLDRAGLDVFEFAGHRCDAIVHGVLQKLRS